MFDARTSVRFWTKVAISAGGCAEWTGATYPNGYGEFHCNGRNHPAHRVAWLMAGRAIPEGHYVLHRCDNRLCVEPGHLFTGTHQENMDDMAAKGRRAAQPGALNGNARLTPEQVAEIRTNSRSHRSLGLEYGVSKTTIGRIKRGTMWQPKGSALREWPS